MPAVVCSHDSLSGIDGGSPSRRQTRVAGLTAGLANRPQRSRQTRGSPHPARHKACTSASGRDRCRGCPSSLVLPRRIARSGCRWCGSERIITGAGSRVYGNLLTTLPDDTYGVAHAQYSDGSEQASAEQGAVPNEPYRLRLNLLKKSKRHPSPLISPVQVATSSPNRCRSSKPSLRY